MHSTGWDGVLPDANAAPDRRVIAAWICAAALALPLPTVAAELPAESASNAWRAFAARQTAMTHPLCKWEQHRSFYWEIGDANGVLASGRVGGRVHADTVMNVGSASKWLYAAYVVEKFGDSPDSRAYLNFTSGYSNFDSTGCSDFGRVDQCPPGPQDVQEAVGGVFHYDGGHMQQHALLIGLGPMRNGALAAEVGAFLGTEMDLKYKKPQPAGGARGTARNYARFLRRLLTDSPQPLQLGALLGSHAVCTLPGEGCNASPEVALPEAWHYGLGHWIEDDPQATPQANFAYSSPGLFGFYPWVDIDRKLYGILARQGLDIVNEAYSSARCGRLIRWAWKTGIPQ